MILHSVIFHDTYIKYRSRTRFISFKALSYFQYLTKQTTTLREINDSRVKIYEQLEVSIADLESTNKQLVEESKTDKTRIKRYLIVFINKLHMAYKIYITWWSITKCTIIMLDYTIFTRQCWITW